MFEVFRSRKMAALVLLGFSSGMPLYLTGRTFQAWLTVEGVDLTTIGFLTLLGIPYSLKFLWSPLLDRYALPRTDRRKGWLLASQIGLVVALIVMSFGHPGTGIAFVATVAFTIAFLSATQDIVIDAYRADTLAPNETGAGAAVLVLGYRIALILTGSLAFILADRLDWPIVYLLMAAAMLMVTLASVFIPGTPVQIEPPQTLKDAVRLPFREFFQRQGWGTGVSILIFVVLYRLGDAMISNMSTPFLLQTGFTQSDVGAIQGGLGLFATIVGVFAGGAIIGSVGLNRSLWILGAAQAFSNLAYVVLAQAGAHHGILTATIIIENICSGLGTAALVGFMTFLCNPRFSATQYALLSSVMAVTRDVLVAPAGALAEVAGWPLFFLVSFVAAFPGFLLLPRFAPWTPRPPSSGEAVRTGGHDSMLK